MAKKKTKRSSPTPSQRCKALEAELAEQRSRLEHERKQRKRLQRRIAALEATCASVTGIDDLTRVTGIGRVIERRLQEAGVATYAQLAEMTSDTQQAVLATLGSFEKRARPDQWVIEARAFINPTG